MVYFKDTQAHTSTHKHASCKIVSISIFLEYRHCNDDDHCYHNNNHLHLKAGLCFCRFIQFFELLRSHHHYHLIEVSSWSTLTLFLNYFPPTVLTIKVICPIKWPKCNYLSVNFLSLLSSFTVLVLYHLNSKL